MELSSFVVEVAAGTVSGALVAALPLLRRHRDSAQPPSSVTVSGDGTSTMVDQSSTSWTHVVDARTKTEVHVTPRVTRQDDVGGELLVFGFIGLAALLGFLFVWPLALGALLGGCVATAVLYLRLLGSLPADCGQLRSHAFGHIVLTLVVTVPTWMLVLLSDADGRGLRGIEGEIATRFPGFSAEPGKRWDVLTQHTSEVFAILRWEGVTMLLLQIAALAMCALLTVLLAMRAVGALALIQRCSGRRIGRWRASLARRLLDERPAGDLWLVALGGGRR